MTVSPLDDESWIMTPTETKTSKPVSIALFVALIAVSGCAGSGTITNPRSADWNPIGWPAKGLQWAGSRAADSGWPLVRDVGRVLTSTALLAETPALWIDGTLTGNSDRLLAASESLIAGSGTVVTSLWNLPFFWVPGRDLDLAADVDRVNSALAYLESLPTEAWRFDPNDLRQSIFPRGTRARATARGHLVYAIPGHGDVLQVGESNAIWNALQWAVGTRFPAQERSWGFCVGTRAAWDAHDPRWRTVILLHELYHQHFQMREWFLGWNPVYWPAYMVTFVFTGWDGHWAEMRGGRSAGVVNRGLRAWLYRPDPPDGSPMRE